MPAGSGAGRDTYGPPMSSPGLGGRGPIVGIDLGTTNSAVGICEGGAVRLLPNPLGDLLTPSAVAIDKGGLIVGRTARDVIAHQPGRGAARFKLDMGSGQTRTVGDRALDAVTLSAHVL